MHRCGPGFLLTITISFAISLTGCLGKGSPNSPNGGVQTVRLNPSGNVSADVGSKMFFSAVAKDANGHAILGTVEYSVVSGIAGSPAPLAVASNGSACAGTWDPTLSICSPGTPGIAVVTAVVEGVSSSPATVYVHYHVDSMQVMPAQQVQPPNDCFSQGQTWLYQGIAYSNNVDITSTVGQLQWSSTNPGVLTAIPFIPPQQPNVLNQVQITADSPGITQLYASVAGTTSNTLPITTCLVQSLRLQAQGLTGNSVTVNTGGSVTLEATAVDTLGFTLKSPPLTWGTSNPEVVSFTTPATTTGTNSATARINLGGAAVTASCTPPTCNIGVVPGMPVYASNGLLPTGRQGFGAISIDVTTESKLPIYTAWAATNMCGNAPGCQSVMFSLTPKPTPIVNTLTVPRTPNSLMFNFQSGPRAYLGSDQGLMFVDVSAASPTATTVSGATTPCNVALCGTVLAISNDGQQVVVSDNVSEIPQVYIYNGTTNAVTDLVLPPNVIATAAAFSPDLMKIFILTNAGTLYVYSTLDAFAPVVAVSSGIGAAFSADSSFAYVAGSAGGVGSISAFSTCSVPGVPSTELGPPVTTAAIPVPNFPIFPSPIVQAVEAGGFDLLSQDLFVLVSSKTQPTSVQVLTAQFTQNPIPDGQFTCNPPNLYSFVASPTLYNLGQGAFTPLYARLVGDASEIVVVGQKNPSVLIFNIANHSTTSIPLVNNGDPLAASSSSDGSQVYVAACDQYQPDGTTCAAGSVHIIDTVSQDDFQQVPYINNNTNNMCNNLGGTQPFCVSNMIGIRPQ